MSWSIDGISWNIPCKVERVSEMTPSEISGMLLNKQYFNDVLGTWLSYRISLAIPKGMEDDYTDLYEILTQPKDGHTFKLPYGQSTVTLTGRISSVSDKYVRLPNNRQTWRNISFEVHANHPTKTMSLSDVVTTGLTPIPSVVNPNTGDLYEWTGSQWVQRFYADAENNRY